MICWSPSVSNCRSERSVTVTNRHRTPTDADRDLCHNRKFEKLSVALGLDPSNVNPN